MSIRRTAQRYKASWVSGSIDRTGGDYPYWQGSLSCESGIVRVYGQDEVGDGEQFWSFEAVHKGYRWHLNEYRSPRDHLTVAGAKRTALRWLRDVVNGEVDAT